MEQKLRGGKRIGVGRKPLNNASKKQSINIFVETYIIWKFGNEEKMKDAIYKFLKDYGEVKATPTPTNGFDAPKATVLNDEPKKSLLPSEQFILEAKEAKSRSELEDVLRSAKKELEYFPYQNVVTATKHLFDKFYSD